MAPIVEIVECGFAEGNHRFHGLIALITSLVLTGSLGPALVIGGGVLLGFYAGFIVLVVLWFVRDSAHATSDEPLPSDSPLP